MRRCLIFLTTLCLTLFLPAASLRAQQRATLSVTVRSDRGDSIPFARVQATTAAGAITVTANARGVAGLMMPYGRAQLVVSTLGYEPMQRDIEIDRPTISTEFVLRPTAQDLKGVDVRAAWIGIRGGVGDETTRRPIADAVITVPGSKTPVVTDSAGRFEIPVAEAGGVVLQVAKPGYETKPVRVEVLRDQPSDVVFFLNPGKDPLYMKLAMQELNRRMAATNMYKFTADREQLARVKKKSLYDALVLSGLLQRNHLSMGKSMCLFINGLALPGFPVSSVVVEDIDFIEVYRYDVTQTLMSEWPKGQSCTSHEQFFPVVGNGPFVGIVSVWTRK